MLKIAYDRNKMLTFKTLKGLVKPANWQTGNPKSGQLYHSRSTSSWLPMPRSWMRKTRKEFASHSVRFDITCRWNSPYLLHLGFRVISNFRF